MNKQDTIYKIDSDKLIDWLKENGYIEQIGTGSRYDDRDKGLHNEKWETDNSYNWELIDEGYDDDWGDDIYWLTNDFEIRETDNFLALSKHIGQDIRAGYEDEQLFIKNKDMTFFMMIHEAMLEVRELDS